MKITIVRNEGRDSFDVALTTRTDEDPFLIVRGCRVMDGSKGRFISWPAKKLDSGKWWNHVRSSDAFTEAVLRELDASEPPKRTLAERKRPSHDDSDIPF